MASVTKTESGTWKALIRRTGWPSASKTFRVKRDAESWARTTEDEIMRGIYVPRSHSEKTSVKDALRRYLKEITPTKTKSTQKAESYRARTLEMALGKYSLAALNSNVISQYRDSRLEEGKSPSTVRLELALLGHLYTTAIKEWQVGITVNPVSNVSKPGGHNGRNRRLSKSEEIALLDACAKHSNPFLGWIVQIALYTAMRQGEILSLKRNQIDLAKEVVILHDTKNKESRTVPLTAKAQLAFQQALAHPVRAFDTDLLFFGEPGKDGKRRSYTINKVWSKALKKAGIEDLRFHDLRHEATSRFVEAGLSDQQVAAITGHKSMQMLRRYTHLRSEDLVGQIRNI